MWLKRKRAANANTKLTVHNMKSRDLSIICKKRIKQIYEKRYEVKKLQKVLGISISIYICIS